MAARTAQGEGRPARVLRATLLGPFSLALGDLAAGPWARPSARRLLQLVLVSSGHRVSREVASEALFPHLDRVAAANSVSRTLSMTKHALSSLGPDAVELLVVEGGFISALPAAGTTLELDVELLEQQLRSGLSMAGGDARDDRLALALADEGTMLEDEPYADWAATPRQGLESLRHKARLALARDRSRGLGRCAPSQTLQAWEACFSHDPASEEAAVALVRSYAAQGRAAMVAATYTGCREALQSLGFGPSPALEDAYAFVSRGAAGGQDAAARPLLPVRGGERRLVSALFVELIAPVGTAASPSPEDLNDMLAAAVAEVFTRVEAMGGTVTAASGAGLAALFGAPVAHEDDPERAVRAALQAVSGASPATHGIRRRAGVETGPAVVGLIGGISSGHYVAVGEVVNAAAALQAAAKPASVLVGAATRTATEALFEWGPSEEVLLSAPVKPIRAYYLQHAKARPTGHGARRRFATGALLAGRDNELSELQKAVRDTTAGNGSVTVLVGEAGLGKTRLVQECRKLFSAWVGGASDRLQLWLEGRAASYALTTPYGLYQQLLANLVGVVPEDGAGPARWALERALRAVLGPPAADLHTDALAHVMGLGPLPPGSALARYAPGQLQQASFEAMIALVSGLSARGPTVLVLEDMHWADPTSLRLTEQIAPLTRDGPLLLLLTGRPEPEPAMSVLESTLGAVPNLRLRALALVPLTPGAERHLARALLGEGTSDEVVEALRTGAEGNPLFLEERLASMLETRALARDDLGVWRLDKKAAPALSEAAERLVRSRVDRLDQPARDAIVAASVLGPEFSLSALKALIDANNDLDLPLAELCSRGLLVELRSDPEPAYRFRHAMIQEATYQGIGREQRRRLHLRAALGIEESSAARLDELAGLIGQHYALAGEAERASGYLARAAERAERAFANDEAIAAYRRALELLGTTEGDHAVEAASIWLKLGLLFWRLGLASEARSALGTAATSAPAGSVLSATSYRWLGQVEVQAGRHDPALLALRKAEKILRSSRDKASDDWVASWLQTQLGMANVHAIHDEVEFISTIHERMRPLVEARAGPRERADFYSQVAWCKAARDRLRLDESVVPACRQAWAIAVEAGLENQMNWLRCALGEALLFGGDLAGAVSELEAALDTAARAGDLSLEAMCLASLGQAYLLQHDVAAVSYAACRLEGLARDSWLPAVGVAKALWCWSAWLEGREDQARLLAAEALQHSPPLVRWDACWWASWWPLTAVRLTHGPVEKAVAAAREVLGQRRLPSELALILSSLVGSWDDGREEAAAEQLGRALQLVRDLYFA